MGQLINFKDFNPKQAFKNKAANEIDLHNPVADEIEIEKANQLTLGILIQSHPGKVCFSIKEVADKLGVGNEFIRRRIKSGIIKASYLGDKPFINIVELARIITEGV